MVYIYIYKYMFEINNVIIIGTLHEHDATDRSDGLLSIYFVTGTCVRSSAYRGQLYLYRTGRVELQSSCGCASKCVFKCARMTYSSHAFVVT